MNDKDKAIVQILEGTKLLLEGVQLYMLSADSETPETSQSCTHPASIPAGVMGDPNRRLCKLCNEEFGGNASQEEE